MEPERSLTIRCGIGGCGRCHLAAFTDLWEMMEVKNVIKVYYYRICG